MSETFSFELVSPERLLMQSDAAMVEVPGMEGDFGVLPGHAPFMSTIRPGVVRISEADGGDATVFFLKGGFAEATPTSLIILAEDAIELDKVDHAQLDADIKAAEKALGSAQSDFERTKASNDLTWMRALKEAA